MSSTPPRAGSSGSPDREGEGDIQGERMGMRRPHLPALVVAGTLAWLMIPLAAQAAGPVRVTTSGSWSVLASSLNDPLSEPAAPDPSPTTNLPPAGCPRTR